MAEPLSSAANIAARVAACMVGGEGQGSKWWKGRSLLLVTSHVVPNPPVPARRMPVDLPYSWANRKASVNTSGPNGRQHT